MSTTSTNNGREPIICAECGASNPWNLESCRLCGADLTAQPPVYPDTDTVDDAFVPPGAATSPPSERKKRVWNIRWIAAGMALFIVLVIIGEKIIEHVIIPADPQLQQFVEEQLQKQEELQRAVSRGDPNATGELGEIDKTRAREFMASKTSLVASLFLLFLIPPIVVGFLVGRFTGVVLEGAISAGGGLLIVMAFLAGQLLLGVILAPFFGLLGALGAFLAKKTASSGPA